MNVEIFLDAGDSVGESPVWDEGTQQLYWVDIVRKKIRAYNPVTETQLDWSTPDFPTALAMKESGTGTMSACRRTLFMERGPGFRVFSQARSLFG